MLFITDKLFLYFLVGLWWPGMDPCGFYQSLYGNKSRLGDVCLSVLLCNFYTSFPLIFVWSSRWKKCLGCFGKFTSERLILHMLNLISFQITRSYNKASYISFLTPEFNLHDAEKLVSYTKGRCILKVLKQMASDDGSLAISVPSSQLVMISMCEKS